MVQKEQKEEEDHTYIVGAAEVGADGLAETGEKLVLVTHAVHDHQRYEVFLFLLDLLHDEREHPSTICVARLQSIICTHMTA